MLSCALCVFVCLCVLLTCVCRRGRVWGGRLCLFVCLVVCPSVCLSVSEYGVHVWISYLYTTQCTTFSESKGRRGIQRKYAKKNTQKRNVVHLTTSMTCKSSPAPSLPTHFSRPRGKKNGRGRRRRHRWS